jgi:hypothetical protein
MAGEFENSNPVVKNCIQHEAWRADKAARITRVPARLTLLCSSETMDRLVPCLLTTTNGLTQETVPLEPSCR